ncbi:beta strand repeat-containing protein [Aphanothece hegewaldii]|uniref:beta strand repeat-containing protein n=1 Tax=Aphanothece hegewaldii TaxID=1521625 RepID=UPI0015E79F0E|nr:filamentous hemagglutinin N-terminal domain-containing protein [Aphanothece hegewaldii]
MTLLGSLIDNGIAEAQIIPDNSLGAENSRTRPDTIKNTPSDVIEGGATRGSNLFHSFQEFNVNEGRGAYFANPDVIQNIFSRVTGGNVSNILGTLGVLGNANLFLINPSGIIFGPNARLDMRGAFIGATADSLVFDNNFEFSTTNPDAPPLLTVNIPIGLRFRENAGDISSTANIVTPSHLTLKAGNLNISGTLAVGGDLTLEALDTLIIRDSVISPFIAASGGNLLLQGNQNVDIYALNHPQSGIVSGKDLLLRSTNAVSGDAHYWSGGSFKIEKLDGSLGGLVSLYDPIIRTVGDVKFDAYQGASLHIIAGGSVYIPGTILITGVDETGDTLASTVTLSDGSTINIDGSLEPTLDIRAGTTAVGNPFFDTDTPTSADIFIGSITFHPIFGSGGKVFLSNQYSPNLALQPLFGGITVGSITTKNAFGGGSVTIDARGGITLVGAVDASSLIGNGGNVTLLSQGNISTGSNILAQGLLGGNITLTSTGDVLLTNGLELNVRGGGGGNITINAQNLELRVGSKLRAGIASGLGSLDAQAGDITINAIGTIAIANSSLVSNAVLQNGKGDAGDIELKTGTLNILDGAVLESTTFGVGNAGKITVNVTDTMTLKGEDSQGLRSGVISLVSSNGIGNSGEIEVNANTLNLFDGARILSNVIGIGDAGKITINVTDVMTLMGKDSQKRVSNISSLVQSEGIGNSGGIEISANTLNLFDGAELNSSTEGLGNAGKIAINVFDTMTLQGENRRGLGSAVISRVNFGGTGNSGGIEISANTLNLFDGARLDSSSRSIGDAGKITISVTDTMTLKGESSLGIGSSIFNGIVGQGNSYGIEVKTNTLLLDKGQISNSIFGVGNADKITINVNGTMTLQGEDSLGLTSAIFSRVAAGAKGNISGIEVNAGTLNLLDGGNINAGLAGIGNAGKVTISVVDTMTLRGSNSEGNVSGVGSQVSLGAEGDSGGIEVKATNLQMFDATTISSSTEGLGNAGKITINVTDTIILGESQNTRTSVSSRVLLGAKGDSEGIEIKAGTLKLLGGGRLNTTTEGIGDAGKIIVNVTGNVTLKGQSNAGEGSSIASAVTPNGKGNSQGIEINATNVILQDAAFIITSTGSNGNAGNIIITAKETVSTSGAKFFGELVLGGVSAFTLSGGEAGDITINTPIFNISDSAEVSAFTQGTGNAGSITINSPQIVNIGQNSKIVVETSSAGQPGNINITTDTLNIGTNAQLSATATATATNTQGGGSININASNLNIAGKLGIFAETQGLAPAGTLTLNPDNANPNLNILFIEQGKISASTSASGNGGDINISAPNNIDVSGNGTIATSTSGSGNAGTINFNTNQLNLVEGVTVTASTIGTGNAGNINLNATQVNLQQATITAFTNGQGNAGSINVPNAQSISLNNSTISTEIQKDGIATEASNITLTSNTLNLDNNSNITASTAGKGDAGEITITANSLTAQGKSSIQTNTTSSSQAGDIIFILQDNLTLTDSTIEASTDPRSSGNGGSINIDPRTVNLNNNARISVNSQGTGDGGSITLKAQNLRLNNRSSISATTASGEGGNITLNIPDTINQRNNSPITATAGGTGNGGNITVNTKFIIGNENSNITANAFQGTGGNINITADGIFRGFNSTITASSQLGVDGVVETNTPEVDPSRGLINLPQNIIDPNTLISKDACRRGSQSEFTVRGRGGLPSTPQQVQSSNEVEVGLVEPVAQESNIVNPSSGINRKIIPAQGWKRNQTGDVVLVAYPTTNSVSRQVNSPAFCGNN